VPSAAKNIGGVLAGAPGAAVGKIVGGELARKLAKMVGSGDYTVNESPIVNSLFPGARQPRAEATFVGDFQRIRFREYVTDILSNGSPDFNIRTVNIQPGLAASFPYLSTIANSFETYKLNGLVYEYIPMVSPYATSAMGSVMMTASYNSTAVPPSSRASMENMNGCIVHRPDKSSMYGVECEGQLQNGYFVRYGDTSTPNNLEDYGRFYVATAGMSATQYPVGTVLGELWVTYDVVLLKHRIPLLIPGYSASFRSGVFNSTPLGTGNSLTPVFLGACFPITLSSTKIYLGDPSAPTLGTIAPGMIVDILYSWALSANGTVNIGLPVCTNCVVVNDIRPPSLAYSTGQRVTGQLSIKLTAVNAVVDFSSVLTGTGVFSGLALYIQTIGATGTYEPGTVY
jgi:hypothetical protein